MKDAPLEMPPSGGSIELLWQSCLLELRPMKSEKAVIGLNPAIAGFESPVKIHRTPSGAKLCEPFSKWITDEASGLKVLQVNDFRTLVQVLNKAKYSDSLQSGMVTYFRGQAHLYSDSLKPSVYRKLKKGESKKSIDDQIEREIKQILDVGGENVKKIAPAVIEGLFQQYEHSSRWIDAVDNVWVALWFACHERWSEKGFVSYTVRNPAKEAYPYAYVMMLAVDQGEKLENGYWRADKSEHVDLRYAVSSHYIRPHLQHGVLVRVLNKQGVPAEEMKSLIRGIVRIDLQSALKWLGESESMKVENMFPGPMFDTGFRDLIDDGKRCGISFK